MNRVIYLSALLSITLSTAATFAQQGKTRADAQAQEYPPLPDNVQRTRVTIWSDGTRMAGDVYRPKIVNPGDTVEVEVLAVDPKARRISLGMKQIQDNPWRTLNERYQVGSRVQGRVRNLTDFGAFIEIEDGVDGLVHVSDISWSRRIKHPSEVLKKMPAEIASRVSKELNAIMARPQIREQIDRQGFALAGSTPEELGAFVKQQLGAWSRGFRDAGINPE